MSSSATVFVVDDDREVRDALQLLMESVGLVVETHGSAQAYLDQFEPERAGCLVVDVRMPGMSGMDLQARLAAERLHPPIIIITGHGDVPMSVRAMKAGATDFIEKPFNDELLLDSIRNALLLDGSQRDQQAELAELAGRLALLTPREHEVMDMVTLGKSNKEIARALDVSAKTVEAHRAKVMEKMQAKSLAVLVRMSISAQR